LFGVHGDVVNAVADFRGRIRDVLRVQPFVYWFPALATVVRSESPGSRNRDPNAIRVLWVENNCVQAHPTRTRLPLGAGPVPTQAGEFVPTLAAVGGAENCCIFDSRVNRVGI